jgi:hypothetical protein
LSLDEIFQNATDKIDAISTEMRTQLKQKLVEINQALLDHFFIELQATLDRQIEQVMLIPLHGQQNEFTNIAEAISFVQNYPEAGFCEGNFRKYEVIIRYSNNDKIDASFQNKEKAISFLHYVEQGAVN